MAGGVVPWYDLAVAKTSISIADEDLQWLRERAARMHDGNLSAAISEAARLLRHHEELGRLLEHLGAPRLTERERAALIAELDGPAAAPRKRRGRAA